MRGMGGRDRPAIVWRMYDIYVASLMSIFSCICSKHELRTDNFALPICGLGLTAKIVPSGIIEKFSWASARMYVEYHICESMITLAGCYGSIAAAFSATTQRCIDWHQLGEAKCSNSPALFGAKRYRVKLAQERTVPVSTI